MKDSYHNSKPAPAFGPVARPSGAGITVDLVGFDKALFVFQSGAMGAVAATYTWKLTESDAPTSGYGDVGAGDMIDGVQTVVFDQAVGTDALAAKKLGYKGNKRYIRAYSTESTAGTPTSIIGASAVLSSPRHAPVSL